MIRMSEPFLGAEEIKNVTEAVKTGWISSSGSFVKEFEELFAKYIGVKHGISVSNGTAALHLALTALGVKSGDEVIVPSLTSIACANTIRYVDAKPVFADSNAEYWCIEPREIEERITRKTKAIMIAHIYGHPCDMDPIVRIGKEHNIPIIEDCAEAHGAQYKGRSVGTFGEIACYSYYGNKIVTVGEGGMCLTNNDELAEKMRILRNQGTKPEYKNKYYYDMVGFNYRLTNVQCAIGVAQMKKIDYLVGKRLELADTYNKLFKKLKEVVTHPCMPWAKNVYWYYSILVNKGVRERVMEHLNSRGIESRPFFYPIHLLPIYKSGTKLPVAEDLGFRGINLPSGPQLTKEQIGEVVNAVAEIVA